MSASSAHQSSEPLVTETARALAVSEPIVITRRSDGTELERIDLVRYAGRYMPKGIDAFVVRSENGKVRVRSEDDLGLSKGSSKVAFRASELGYSPPAA